MFMSIKLYVAFTAMPMPSFGKFGGQGLGMSTYVKNIFSYMFNPITMDFFS